MADQSNRGPINIPIESLDDDAASTGAGGGHDDDVFEIDGDSVQLDNDPFIFDSGDDLNVTHEAPVQNEAQFLDTAENEPVAITVDSPGEDAVIVEPIPVVVDAPIEADALADDAEELDPDEAPTLTDIDPPVEAESDIDPPVVAASDFDPPVAPAGSAADSGQRAPEISRQAVIDLMLELRQKTDAIARLSDERTDLYDKLLRKQAEFENFRKRGEREMQEAYVRARADLLTDLLPVLDNFDLAMQHAENASADVIHEGMRLIYRQMLDSLLRIGLEPIDADGQPFDPELHEAVATEVSEEVPDHTVVNVLQRGYRLGDRMLRPARVKVAVQS